jgi:hypothetical protein
MPSEAEGVVKRHFKLQRWRGGVSTDDLVCLPYEASFNAWTLRRSLALPPLLCLNPPRSYETLFQVPRCSLFRLFLPLEMLPGQFPVRKA